MRSESITESNNPQLVLLGWKDMNRRQFTLMMSSLPMLSFANWTGASNAPSPLKTFVRTNWSQDPFALGVHSYLAKDSGNKDRITLLEPIGDRVFFAGEALTPNNQSMYPCCLWIWFINQWCSGQLIKKRIAIIGTGISGLAAAQQLSEKGLQVTIFEGRDRLGGRILSDRSLGATVDLGATWIHSPDGNPISALADKADMQRIETDDEYVIRGKGGKKIWMLFAPNWLLNVQA